MNSPKAEVQLEGPFPRPEEQNEVQHSGVELQAEEPQGAWAAAVWDLGTSAGPWDIEGAVLIEAHRFCCPDLGSHKPSF